LPQANQNAFQKAKISKYEPINDGSIIRSKSPDISKIIEQQVNSANAASKDPSQEIAQGEELGQ